MTTFTPRGYQETAVTQIINILATDSQALLQAATGAGKTVMAGMLIKRFLKPEQRCVIIVHTKELADQPIKRFRQFFKEIGDFGVVQSPRTEINRRVMSCTFQSLASSNFRRLKALIACGAPALVIEDECHRSASPQRRAILMMLMEANPNLKVVGLSATPFRSDGKQLYTIFGRSADPLSIKLLTSLGHLAPVTAYNPKLPVDFSKVKSTGSGMARDYAREAMQELMDADNINEIIYKKWLEVASDRKTLCFTVGIKQVMALCHHFYKNGVNCAAVAGNKKYTGIYRDGVFVELHRDVILEQLEHGDIQVVFNCQVLTEGFDAPVISCILLARPCRAPGPFVQMVGRGLRLHPGKEDCIVICFCPTNAAGLLTADDLYGRHSKEKAKIAKGVEEGVVEEAITNEEFGLGIDVDPDKVFMDQIDLLRKSSYAWLTSEDISAVGLGSYRGRMHGVAVVRAGVLNGHLTERIAKGEAMDNLSFNALEQIERMKSAQRNHSAWYFIQGRNPIVIATDTTMAGATRKAELYADTRESKFANKKLKQRKRPLSEGLKNNIRQYGLDIDGTFDKGSRALFLLEAKRQILGE